MDERMRAWAWPCPGEDKYCDSLTMDHNDSEPGERYVDSLQQLNKIVERILPEKSPLSLVSVRPKHDAPLRRSTYIEHNAGGRDLHRKLSLAGSLGELQHHSPVKHGPLSTVPSVCLQESLRLKALRPSDSLNDSAYETYCGDGSNDAIDAEEKLAKTDELSSGNDQADYCSSSSGRKSEDDTKSLFSSRERDAEVHGSGYLKKYIGEHVVGSSFSGDCSKQKSLDDAVFSDLDAMEPSDNMAAKHSLPSDLKTSSLRVTDGLFSGNNRNSGSRVNSLPLGESASADNLLENEKCSTAESYGTITNTPVRSSLYAARHGSTDSNSLSIDTSYQTGQKTGIMRDRSSVSDEELKSFTCPHCAYSASKKGQVRKHLSVHGIFLCAHCEFACDRADLLEEHRRLRHPGLCGRRLCKKCRVLFQSSELEAHEQQCSGEKQRWACHTCGKEFKFLSVMKAHAHKWHPSVDDGVKPVDAGSDTASSKPCSVSSGTPTTTQPESVVGRESKQFQCPECGKLFKTKWTLSNHSLLHAGADTPFCCDVDGCSGVTFRSDKELNCHRMAVHRLGPTKYECSHPGCTMQFAKYGHYKRHQLTHAASSEPGLASPDVSGRRFVCDWAQCGKSFSHPDNLRVHYRRHTDEKPYHCHHCEAAYRQKSGLKYHLEKVHGEKTVGRMGRKRKLAAENDSILAAKQLQSDNGFRSTLSGARSGELNSPVGQTFVSDSEAGSGVAGNVRQTVVSKLPVREASVNVCDSQTNEWAENSDAGKTRNWSESLSQACPDDLENIDINDEWLLNEEDGFIARHPPKPCEVGAVGRSTEEADRDPNGSTSDTEPLDEDICEELRKLSDAINSEVLSPRGLDSLSSPFGSPSIGPTLGPVKSDGIGNILPDVSLPHPDEYRDIGASKDRVSGYDGYSTTPPQHESGVTTLYYSEHPATSVSTSSIHGQCKSEEQSEMVNGYVAEGYSCPEWRPAHFGAGTAGTSDSAHLPLDGVSYHAAGPCEGSVHPWSVPVSYSRWSSQLDNSPFLPACTSSSLPTSTAAISQFVDPIGRHDTTNPMLTWSSAEMTSHWPGRDSLISSWSRRQMAMRGQSDLYMQRGYSAEWQHRQSMYSRTGAACDGRVNFEIMPQTSPQSSAAYHSDVAELAPMSERFVDSYVGKRGGVYRSDSVGSSMGSWPELYEQSSHMEGIGNYDYRFPRNFRRSPLQSDRLYLTSGYSGMQSPASYERGADTDGVYCVSNSPYSVLPGHAPSWPMPGFSGAGESVRRMPETQQSSVLYNVVPRYY